MIESVRELITQVRSIHPYALFEACIAALSEEDSQITRVMRRIAAQAQNEDFGALDMSMGDEEFCVDAYISESLSTVPCNQTTGHGDMCAPGNICGSCIRTITLCDIVLKLQKVCSFEESEVKCIHSALESARAGLVETAEADGVSDEQLEFFGRADVVIRNSILKTERLAALNGQELAKEGDDVGIIAHDVVAVEPLESEEGGIPGLTPQLINVDTTVKWMFCASCGWQTEKPGMAMKPVCPECTTKMSTASMSQGEYARMREEGKTVKELCAQAASFAAGRQGGKPNMAAAAAGEETAEPSGLVEMFAYEEIGMKSINVLDEETKAELLQNGFSEDEEKTGE